jgi:LCP family protein required for cell wall assembly
LRRTWGQRLLLATNLLLIVACLATAGALAYAYDKAGQITRVSLGAVLDQPPAAAPGAPRAPENFLLVGTDDATGLDPHDPVLIGRPPGLRSDTIMILRVDPSSERASLLSLPRDLWVRIAGTKGSERINTAIQAGPDALVETIRKDFGIPINHYVEVNFLGFRDLVAAVDGVPVYFPEPVRDRKTGLNIPQAGCAKLDPVQALAYARSRAYEFFSKGRWHVDGTGDLGRISRQQDFMRRVLRRAISRGARNPAVLNQLVNAGIHSVHVDDSLTISDLIDLGNRFRQFNPDTLSMYSVPVSDAVINGANVLRLDDRKAQPVLDIFRGVAQNTDLSSFTVGVRNGTGASGGATRVADDLRSAGFNVPADGISDADRFDYARTTLFFQPEHREDAELVARYLKVDPVLTQSAYTAQGDVVLVSGADYAGVLDQPRAASPSTTPTSAAGGGSSSSSATSSSTSSSTSTTVIGEVPGPPPPNVNC